MTERTISRRKILKGGGIGLATGLAGCTGTLGTDGAETGHHTDAGNHEEGGHGGAIGEPVKQATVTMVTNDSSHHFDPHIIWVKPGGTVTWEVESGSHTATAYHPDTDKPLRIPDGATPWDSETLSETGVTFEHSFETKGVYDYYCSPHEATGMIGSVIVGEPDAHGQPGLAASQDDLPEKAQSKIAELNTKVDETLGYRDDETSTESNNHDEGGEHHEEATTESGSHHN